MDHRERMSGRHRPPQPAGLFRDRADAAEQLGVSLQHLRRERPIVLGIARGGVVIARGVARALDAELDVFVARKLGLPGHSELAMGAVASDGTCYVDRDLVLRLGVSDDSLAYVKRLQIEEAERRERLLRSERPALDVRGRTVILIDDGLATGATMRVAVRSLALRRPARLVVAVPVGAPETCAEIAGLVDELVCLERPHPFHAVGRYYESFEQVGDGEVIAILRERAQRRAS